MGTMRADKNKALIEVEEIKNKRQEHPEVHKKTS